jgi:hypothetical protein
MTNRGGVTPRAGAAAAGAIATALDVDPEPTHAAAATITDINASLNTPTAHRSVTAPTSAIGRSVQTRRRSEGKHRERASRETHETAAEQISRGQRATNFAVGLATAGARSCRS